MRLSPSEHAAPESTDSSAVACAAGTLLELRNLSLTLGGQPVIDGVNLAIAPGEIHALLGANGAGKSSLAYAIMGCEGYALDAGEILFAGERINALPLHERARRGITLAWQEPARFEGLAAHHYLALGGTRVDAARCLDQVGLAPWEYLFRPVDKTLSGGERKRIELAAVLAMQPKLAILDEPAAGIDLLSLDEIVGVIEALNRAGAAILLITHQENVAAHAHRASQLCGGRIVDSGATAEVIEHYKARRCQRCNGRDCGHG
jgi:Fe-S cluster assembly ATP-binding protein